MLATFISSTCLMNVVSVMCFDILNLMIPGWQITSVSSLFIRGTDCFFMLMCIMFILTDHCMLFGNNVSVIEFMLHGSLSTLHSLHSRTLNRSALSKDYSNEPLLDKI